MVPEAAGLLEFNTEGGVPELQVEMKLVIYGLVNYYTALKLMRQNTYPDTPSPGGGNDVIVGAGGVVDSGGVGVVVTGGVGVVVTGGDGVAVTGGNGVVGVGVVDDR